MNHIFDCIIIGGGIAGLQAAIQLGRYKHEVLVIDKEDGRSTLCKSYHNILGYPDGVSGEELRKIGRQQAESLDVQFLKDSVESVKKVDSFFSVMTEKDTFSSRKLLIATGVLDHIPPLQELFPCLGVSVYLCPDCDGYEVQGKKTVVIGNGSVGANMAITLLYWTKELIYINHGGEEIAKNLQEELSKHDIPIYEQTIQRVITKGSEIRGFALENDQVIETSHSFIAFGGNKVRSDLAVQLGVEVLDNNHIKVHPRTKMTNIEGVWAAGDVVAHSEQVTIAMGEGSQAAIWIHKSLLKA